MTRSEVAHEQCLVTGQLAAVALNSLLKAVTFSSHQCHFAPVRRASLKSLAFY